MFYCFYLFYANFIQNYVFLYNKHHYFIKGSDFPFKGSYFSLRGSDLNTKD